MSTSLYDFGRPFQPTAEFLKEPYVMGVYNMLTQLFRVMVCGGKSWPPRKIGEFSFAAFDSFCGAGSQSRFQDFLQRSAGAKGQPEYETGLRHGELVFGAYFGLIPQSEADPIVVKAREMAPELSRALQGFEGSEMGPDAGFTTALIHLTLKEKLEELFPDIDG
ncbi:hypothetical protein GTH22_00660 [Oceanicola sp. 502str15]|nr:hypothetical protein [Oceanicola sp. 502str15]